MKQDLVDELWRAAMKGEYPKVKELLDSGADPKSIYRPLDSELDDKYRYNLLGWAIENQKPELVKILCEPNVELKEPVFIDPKGLETRPFEMALDILFNRGPYLVENALLQYGAVMKDEDDRYRFLENDTVGLGLWSDLVCCGLEVLLHDDYPERKLSKRKAAFVVGTIRRHLGDELWQAAMQGDYARVTRLLKDGADPNSTQVVNVESEPGDYHYTLLGWAIRERKPELVQILCEHNANANYPAAVDSQGCETSPWKLAIDILLSEGPYLVEEALLQHGAEIKFKDLDLMKSDPYLGRGLIEVMQKKGLGAEVLMEWWDLSRL